MQLFITCLPYLSTTIGNIAEKFVRSWKSQNISFEAVKQLGALVKLPKNHNINISRMNQSLLIKSVFCP